MPELPEIVVFARDMQRELAGRAIVRIKVLQPKCLNPSVEQFQAALTGATIQGVSAHGK
jgi:formamidopyrimidine-DNA glycosylase